MQLGKRTAISLALLILAVFAGVPAWAGVLLSEDFDSYAPGDFPTGWNQVYSGTGWPDQVVTDSEFVSAPNSYTMTGRSGWSAVIERVFSTSSDIVTFGAKMRVKDGSSTEPTAGLSLWNRYESTWGVYYCRVRFQDTAITLDNQWMMNYSPNQWYDIEVRYNATTRKASVWIDGSLKADEWNVYSGGVGHTALALSSEHGGLKCYFDDVAVSEPDPPPAAFVSLDHVVGSYQPNRITEDKPLSFHFRVENMLGSPVIGFENGFRIYSPDGATWQLPILDTASLGWTTMFDGGIFFDTSGTTGSGADTLVIAGVIQYGPGMPDGFSEVVWSINTEVDATNTGLHLCIDSSYAPPSHIWQWIISNGSIQPQWDGPHCFEIVANLPPEITNGIPVYTDNHCYTFVYDFDAFDLDGDPYWFYLVSGPGAIDTATGVWSYVPLPEDVGTAMSIAVQACDTYGCGSEWNMVLNITNEAPVFNTGCGDTVRAQLGMETLHQMDAVQNDCDPLTYTIIDANPWPAGSFWMESGTGLFHFEPDSSDLGVIDFTAEVHDGIDYATCGFYVNVTYADTLITVSYNDPSECYTQPVIYDRPMAMLFTNPSPFDPVTLESVSFQLYKEPGTECNYYPNLEVFVYSAGTDLLPDSTLFSHFIIGESVCQGWADADSIKQIDIAIHPSDTIVVGPAGLWFVGLWMYLAPDTVFLVSDSPDTVDGPILHDGCSCWWDSPPRTIISGTSPLNHFAWNECFNLAISTNVLGPSFMTSNPIDDVTWEFYDHFVSGWPLENHITIDINELYQDRIDSLVIPGPGYQTYVFHRSLWESDPDYKFTFIDSLIWTQGNSVTPFAIHINGTEYHRNCYRCWEKPLRDALWADTDTAFVDLADPDGRYETDAAVPRINLSWSDTLHVRNWDFVNSIDLNADVAQDVYVNGAPDDISVNDTIGIVVFSQELYNQSFGATAYDSGQDPTISIFEVPELVLWDEDWKIINDATIAYFTYGVIEFLVTGDVGIKGDFTVSAKLCYPESYLCGDGSVLSYGGAYLTPAVTPYSGARATARVLYVVGKVSISLKTLFRMEYPIFIDGVTGDYSCSHVYDFDLNWGFKIKVLWWTVYNAHGTLHLYDDPKGTGSKDVSLEDLWTESDLADNTWYGPPSMAVNNNGQRLMTVYVHRTGEQSEEVYFARLVNSSWTVPVPLTNSSSPKSYPKVEPYGPSSFAAVWEQHEGEFDTTGFTLDDMYDLMCHQEIMVSTYDTLSGNWSLPVRLTEDSNADGAPVVAGSGDNLHVVWARHDDVGSFDRGSFKIYRAFYDGLSWSTPEPLVSQSGANMQPTIATDPTTGVAKVIWVHDEDGDIITPGDRVLLSVNIDSTGQVSTPPDTVPTPLGPFSPSLAFSPGGEEVVCYENWGVCIHSQGDTTITDTVGIGDAIRIGSSLNRGTGWVTLDIGDYTTTGYGTDPQVTIDELGMAHLAYRAFEKGQPGPYDGEIGYSTVDLNDPGATWSWPTWYTDDSFYTDMGDIACLPGGQVRIQYLKETYPTTVFSGGLDKIYEIASQYVGVFTWVGDEVVVNPMPGAVVMFHHVFEEGWTTGFVNTSGPELPEEWVCVPNDPPAFFDISTTADFEAPIEITLDIGQIEWKGDKSDFVLLQHLNGAWVNITTEVDLQTNTITGSTTELGTFVVAMPSACCIWRGDINHDGLEQPDIADLVYLVTYMFQDGPPPLCNMPGVGDCSLYYYAEADINGDGTCVPDIADLVYLVTYMFQDGPELVPCP